MDEASYGPFWNEMQELALCCWLSGGRVMVNKKCHYLHLHKGKKYGRGYRLPESALVQGRNHTMKWIWNEAWSKQTLPFEWLIDHFWPVPGWREDWREMLYATRRPRAIGIGITIGDNGGDVGAAGSDSGGTTEEVDSQSVKADSHASGGLRIHQAHYGVGGLDDIDVRDRLQSLVVNDALDIAVNNSTLTPNTNPFRGKKKQLNVTYSYDGGNVITATRDEKDWLIIGQAQPRLVETGEPRGGFEQEDPLDYARRIGSRETAELIANRDGRTQDVQPVVAEAVKAGYASASIHADAGGTALVLGGVRQPMSTTALNDYLIRKFSISPQRLRAPMPIELRDFHRNNLAQLFAELGFKRGVEVGVAEGNYSEALLKANPTCELLLVDPWHAYSDNPQNKSKEKHEFAYNETLRKTKGYPNVTIMQDYSMNAVRAIKPESLDFAYVDANHLFDECVMDIIEWSKRVRSGGIVSGDDYYTLDQKRWVGGGVVEAVNAYVGAHRISPWFIFVGHKSTDFFWVKP